MNYNIEDIDIEPECMEELFGFLMDKEQNREKEIESLIATYRRIEDINYCVYITKRFILHKIYMEEKCR